MDTIVFATNNEHKLLEVNQLLGKQFSLVTLQQAGINQDIPEDKLTLEDNATQKAEFVFNKLLINVFADDTGLEIEALNGEPGVFSARYAGSAKDAKANMQKVLDNMRGKTNRKACFRTVVCLILNEKKYLFEGKVDGEILDSPMGADGFGYDPIFRPFGYNQSFAEMPLCEKNKISHRANAVNKLVSFLKSYPSQEQK